MFRNEKHILGVFGGMREISVQETFSKYYAEANSIEFDFQLPRFFSEPFISITVAIGVIFSPGQLKLASV